MTSIEGMSDALPSDSGESSVDYATPSTTAASSTIQPMQAR
jgi:hypothetical protein